MKLWTLVRSRGLKNPIAFLATALGATVADSLVFATVTGTAVSPDFAPTAAIGLPTLMVVLALAAMGRSLAQVRVSWWFADVVADIRRTMLGSAKRIEPSVWEQISKVEVRQGLSSLPARLSAVADSIGNAVYATIQAAVLCSYLFWLYWPVGLITLAGYLVSGFCVARLAIKSTHQEAAARQADNDVRAGLTDLVLGRKEMLLDPAKAKLLFADVIVESIARRRRARAPVHSLLSSQMVLHASTWPILVAAGVLCVALRPAADDGMGPAIAVLLIYTMPFTMFQIVPQIISGEVGAMQVEALENHLAEAAAKSPPESETTGDEAHFKRLELVDVSYRYSGGRNKIVVGPLSLKIEPGTITFITGENGGGKSTLVKLLAGTYAPNRGTLVLNGAPVDLRYHRALFSMILSEHYLFERLFGLGRVDPRRVNALLDKFGVGHVTDYQDGRFSRIELSTGQKKRVGLVVALLEDKPILVLDEWAAEQDPAMRERYYREILPELKAANKAIVAVTHDDRYFGACDQLVVMRDGKIRSIGPPDRGEPPSASLAAVHVR
jgi:putative pyoverdin transport system ATP-binding/permease protein